MENLSSCYFCGTALDDPLQEYPVVPEPLRGDGEVTTATLCPACRQKLDTVHDAVLDAVDATSSSGNAATPVSGDTATATDAAPPAESTDSEPAADTSRAEEGTEPDESAGDGATDGDGDELVDLDADAADDVAATDESAGGDETTDDVTAEDVDALAGDIDSDILDEDDTDEKADAIESEMEPDVPSEFQSGDTGTEEPTSGAEPPRDEVAGDTLSDDAGRDETPTDEDTGTGTEDGVETATGDDPTGGEETADSGDAQTDEAGADEASEAGSTGEDVRQNVSALEYNKVMRLLQNREFPVEREEIETVATNAYDLSRSECASVIDLAVDRGLVDEDGDQLVRPE